LLENLKNFIVWNPVSSLHPQKPAAEMYFGTVGCRPHPTYQ